MARIKNLSGLLDQEGAFELHTVYPFRARKEKELTRYGFIGTTVQDIKPILKRSQLLQCIDCYMNDGTIRAMVNKRTDFICGNRPKNKIEPNEVVTLKKLSTEALQAVMTETEADELQIKINIINKRVGFHEKLTNLIIQNFVIGRAAGGIERRLSSEFPIYGEPIALKVLNSLRLKSPIIDTVTHELVGIKYDFGEVNRTDVPIPTKNLLPLTYNDHNLYDNTLHTGMSAIWPIIAIAQANGYLNDEDIPESAKTIWAKYGFVFVGDKNPDSMEKFKQASKVGTLMYHNNANLKAEIVDVKSDLRELTDVRMANMKAMCINFGFPMFLLFEDSANFATAREVMQGYKASVLERDRTWLRGFLEKYWYDPILADHLRIKDPEKLLRAKIQIKAAFDDVNFETRRDIVETDVQLQNAGVYLPIDTARDIDADPEIQTRLENVSEEQFDLSMKVQRNNANPQLQKPAGGGKPTPKKPKRAKARGP